MGECGLTEHQAAMTTLHEYRLRFEGFDRQRRFEWEQTRWKVWQLMTPHYKKGQAPKTPQAFMRFPWEKMTEEEVRKHVEDCHVTQEQADELNRIFAEIETR